MSTTTTSVPAATNPRAWLVLLFTLGPVATVAGLMAGVGPFADVVAAAPLWMALTVALAIWSPLPFSLPAVLLDGERDLVQPDARGWGRVTRALVLVPYMATRSPARREFVASLVGFVIAALVAAPTLLAALG